MQLLEGKCVVPAAYAGIAVEHAQQLRTLAQVDAAQRGHLRDLGIYRAEALLPHVFRAARFGHLLPPTENG
jgi:hypothetical protein